MSKTDKSLFSYPTSVDNSPGLTQTIDTGVFNSARAGPIDQIRPFTARETPHRLNDLKPSTKTLDDLALKTEESSPPAAKNKPKVTHTLNLSKLRPA